MLVTFEKHNDQGKIGINPDHVIAVDHAKDKKTGQVLIGITVIITPVAPLVVKANLGEVIDKLNKAMMPVPIKITEPQI